MKKPTFGRLFNRVFFTMTVLTIAMEVWASRDNNEETIPWTYWLLGHFHIEVIMALIGALTFWLIVHFWSRRNWKKSITPSA